MSFEVQYMSDEELEEERICENCGRTYTIAEAYDEFFYAFPPYKDYSADLEYASVCDGELCGSCAVDKVHEQWEQPYEFEVFNEYEPDEDDEDEEDY